MSDPISDVSSVARLGASSVPGHGSGGVARRRRLARVDPPRLSRSSALGCLLLLIAGCDVAAPADPEAARESASGPALLERAIAFHDPEGVWPSAELELHLEESRPDGTVRETSLRFDNGVQRARIETQRDGHDVVMELDQDAVSYQVDASADVAQELVEALRLGDDQVRRMRNYYTYLYGLPMKLRDPGTRVDDEIERTTFQGRAVDALRVTYDPDVGSDTWVFYLDPQTSALVGYRFFHDEGVGDGEYVVLEGLEEVDELGLRLPRRRTWYTNQEDELLGTDTIVRSCTPRCG